MTQRIKALWRSLATLGTLSISLHANAYIRLTATLVSLVFPSGHVTISKVLWLMLGLALAAIHLSDVLTTSRHKKTHRLYLVDHVGPQSRTPVLIPGRGATQVKVESSHFQGHLAITTTCNRVALQLHGRLSQKVSPSCQMCFALEFRFHATGYKWFATVARAVVHTVWEKHDSHFGSRDGYETKVELPLMTVLPCAAKNHFGDDCRKPSGIDQVTGDAIGHDCTFKASLSALKWQLLLNLALGALEWLPVTWVSLPSVHLVAYLVSPLSRQDQQALTKARDMRRNVFCFSLQTYTRAERKPKAPQGKDRALDVERGSPIALYPARKHRQCGVPRAHAKACRQIAEDARALRHVSFSLDAWVECVDRVAGRRKVGYLINVVDTTQRSQRTVMRSAVTIKHAILRLLLEHQREREETASAMDTTTLFDKVEIDAKSNGVDFQNLSIESREYRYEQIEHETSTVARVLSHIASTVPTKRFQWRLPQSCYQNQLEKAALYRCLVSPSHLPAIPSYQAIGIQRNTSQDGNMKVVCEMGIYRLHGAGVGTTSLLRQEWCIVATDYLHFYRSYSVSPSLSICVTKVLDVRSLDHVSLLTGPLPRNGPHKHGTVPRWFGVEIHLVVEIIALFVETLGERDLLVASLQSLAIDGCNHSSFKSDALATKPLFCPMKLESQSHPVCLNQRTSRFVDNSAIAIDAKAALQVVQESLEAGLKVFALGETAARQRIHRSTVLDFVDKVEKLNCLDLNTVATKLTNEDRFALGLNLYHTLFTHAVLVFGYPRTHEQWKLVQTVPCYLLRIPHASVSVKYTLADLQRVVLQCPVPVNLEALSLKRSLSQQAVLNVAIGGGDALNGLCRAVLGVAWTPVLPSSSSLAHIMTTPRPISTTLAIDCADLRTSLVLQINSTPPMSKSMGIMRVYDGRTKLSQQLNSTCTRFLKRELRLNETNRIIYLPRVCEWYCWGSQQEANIDLNASRRVRRRQSRSGPGVAALPTSRGFYCLQRVLGYMEEEQHHRAMHLLLGAGDECRFVVSAFWTQPSRSTAAHLLTSAGNAALSVLSSVTDVTGGTSSLKS